MPEETKVHEAVVAEIKALGDNTRALYDEQKKQLADLQKTVDEAPSKTDALVAEKVKKLQEDIMTRQEAFDAQHAKAQKRVDALEATIKRSGFSGGEPNSKEFKAACDFKRLTLSRSGKDPDELDESTVDADEYKTYIKTLKRYLRRPGDERNLTPEQFKTLSVGVDPDGGFTVPVEQIQKIVERIWQMDAMAQLADTQTISRDTLEYWVDRDEAADTTGVTESLIGGVTATPQIGLRQIPTFYIEARPRATQQVLDDSTWDLESWLMRKVGERIGRTTGAQHISGTGVGQARGILTYGNGTAWGTVEQVNLGAAAVPTTDGLINLKFHLMDEYLSGATWLMNRMTVMQIMILKDGDGRYIWREGISEGTPSILLGLPIRTDRSMPVVAVNALSVAIGDWKQAYMIVQRQGITIQRDPYTVKPLVEFYTRARMGGDVADFDALKIGVIAV